MKKLFNDEAEEVLCAWHDMVYSHVRRMEDALDDMDFNSTEWWKQKSYIDGMYMCLSMFSNCERKALRKLKNEEMKE